MSKADETKMPEFDLSKAQEYDKKDHHQVFARHVAKLLQSSSWDWLHKSKLQILDFGCGTGQTTLELAKQGHHVTGVDVSEPMLEQFRAKLSTATTEAVNKDLIALIHMRTVDGSDLLISDNNDNHNEEKYDAVFVIFVLHHVPSKQQEVVIANLTRTLKIGGRLVMLEIDPSERVHQAMEKFHSDKQATGPKESSHQHHHDYEHHHSKDGSDAGDKQHTEETHHHHHEWLDRATVIAWMENTGCLSPPDCISFEISNEPEWIMDCYHVTAKRIR